MNKIRLIKELLELVEEEQKYKKEYDQEYQRILRDGMAGWERNKFSTMRTPNNATIKDAMRIVGRLSFQVAKEGDRR